MGIFINVCLYYYLCCFCYFLYEMIPSMFCHCQNPAPLTQSMAHVTYTYELFCFWNPQHYFRCVFCAHTQPTWVFGCFIHKLWLIYFGTRIKYGTQTHPCVCLQTAGSNFTDYCSDNCILQKKLIVVLTLPLGALCLSVRTAIYAQIFQEHSESTHIHLLSSVIVPLPS